MQTQSASSVAETAKVNSELQSMPRTEHSDDTAMPATKGASNVSPPSSPKSQGTPPPSVPTQKSSSPFQEPGSFLPQPAATPAACRNDDFLQMWLKNNPSLNEKTQKPESRPPATYVAGATDKRKSSPRDSRTPRLLKQMRRDAQKASSELEAYVLRVKRKIRSGRELDSSAKGELPLGAIVRILERADLPDGTHRVRVAKFDDTESLGWVSRFYVNGSDRLDALHPFHWMRFQRNKLSTSPPGNRASGDEATPESAARMSVTRRRRSISPSSPSADSSVHGQSSNRQQNGRPASPLSTSFTTKPTALRANSKSFLFRSQSAKEQASAATSQEPKQDSDTMQSAAQQKAASLPGSTKPRAGKAFKTAVHTETKAQEKEASEEKSASFKAKETLLPASTLQEIADELNEKADDEIQRAQANKTVAVLLGEALQRRSDAAPDKAVFHSELFREWDPNRDGNVSKMEFRTNVRKLLEKPDVKEIDRLFDKLDLDRNGELDIKEVQVALQTLMKKAKEAAVDQVSIHKKADYLRKSAEEAQTVADATRAAEQADRELKRVQNKSVAAQLGMLMAKKGPKASDLISKWGGPDGSISKNAFFQQLQTLGLTAARADVDKLFDELDEDGGGTLDTDEVKRALRKLADESETARDVIKHANVLAVDKMKAAKMMQAEWKQKRAEDERAEEEAREQQRLEEEAKAVEAEQAKAAKLAAEERKRMEEEQAKAAFAERVKLKREQTRTLRREQTRNNLQDDPE